MRLTARSSVHPAQASARSDLLLLQGWGQGLLQLLGLSFVRHKQGVQVLAAPDLELGLASVLLYLHGLGVLAASDLQERADLTDLLRHCWLLLRPKRALSRTAATLWAKTA